ncbi:MAG: hypothetical protein WA001_00215 [Patescibacteria group bacterium]
MGIQDDLFDKAYLTCFEKGPITSITYGEPERRIAVPILEKHATLFPPGLRFQIEARDKLHGHYAAMVATYEQTFPCDLVPTDRYWSRTGSTQRRLRNAHLGFCFLTLPALKLALKEFWRRTSGRKRVKKTMARGTSYIFEIKRGERFSELTVSHAAAIFESLVSE